MRNGHSGLRVHAAVLAAQAAVRGPHVREADGRIVARFTRAMPLLPVRTRVARPSALVCTAVPTPSSVHSAAKVSLPRAHGVAPRAGGSASARRASCTAGGGPVPARKRQAAPGTPPAVDRTRASRWTGGGLERGDHPGVAQGLEKVVHAVGV